MPERAQPLLAVQYWRRVTVNVADTVYLDSQPNESGRYCRAAESKQRLATGSLIAEGRPEDYNVHPCIHDGLHNEQSWATRGHNKYRFLHLLRPVRPHARILHTFMLHRPEWRSIGGGGTTLKSP